MFKKTIFTILATIAVTGASVASADQRGSFRAPVQQPDDGSYDQGPFGPQPGYRGGPPAQGAITPFNRPMNIQIGLPSPIRTPLVGECTLQNPMPGHLSGRLYISGQYVGDFYQPAELAALRVILSTMWGITGNCRVVNIANF